MPSLYCMCIIYIFYKGDPLITADYGRLSQRNSCCFTAIYQGLCDRSPSVTNCPRKFFSKPLVFKFGCNRALADTFGKVIFENV